MRLSRLGIDALEDSNPRHYCTSEVTVAEGVDFYIQFGTKSVQEFAGEQGRIELFEKVAVKLINPGCGACIRCGPGVSEITDQVTVSAINRNFSGRSGPGNLYLASPLSVAASAFIGTIAEYREGMSALIGRVARIS